MERDLAQLQGIVIGEKVYMGGGFADSKNAVQVFQYDPSGDEWSHLPPHHVEGFAMAQFEGSLITVGV